ncbi:MAG: S8 family serine peptidase [Phycisphaerales bacterium]|nr:MAG: S8 family serine peptidase [Phycisphaerales bacterium]
MIDHHSEMKRWLAVWVCALAGSAVASPQHYLPDARLPEARATEMPALAFRWGPVHTSGPDNLLGAPLPDPEPRARYVLRLDGPMTPARHDALTLAGATLGNYVPPHAYVVTLSPTAPSSLAQLPFVTWLGHLQPQWKIAPSLLALFPSDDPGGGSSQEPIPVLVSLFPDEDTLGAIDDLLLHGATNVSSRCIGDRWFFAAAIPPVGIELIAENPTVELLEPAPGLLSRNDSNAWIAQSNINGSTPVWDGGLLGQDQIAGLIDTGVDRDQCAFRDSAPVGPWHRKFVAVRGVAFPDAHGTNVASSLVGDAGDVGTPDGYDGIAPLAKLSFSDFVDVQADPLSVYARFQDAHEDGARAHNNSWGDDTSPQEYNILCNMVDQFSYDFEESLVLFSVTNLPNLRTPENAKNVLAVGASMDAPWQNEHYSGGTGPTTDGRRKPEVYAPGLGTNCARHDPFASCLFEQASGTSMACPVVAGGALLARQYFVQGYHPLGVPGLAPPSLPFIPSAALLKAVILNGAVDMTGVPSGGNEYPSDQEGWGRMLLDNTLYFPGDIRKLWVYDLRNAGGLSTGQNWTSPTIDVMSDSVPLRVTLAFTEPPGAVLASDPVVNNLDLELRGPIGPNQEHYLGNFFSGGQSVPDGTPDPRNNVEQVHLLAPMPGTYVVTVVGTEVNQGTQGFALVVTGDMNAPHIPPDCNTNGIPDYQDIDNGTSPDCQSNGIPDECESLSDCDTNQIPDVCEFLPDCNSNGIPDLCEPELDCNTNGIPDDCEDVDDCNYNGTPDTCDLLLPDTDDCQPNGIPDECETPLSITTYPGPGGIAIPDANTDGVSVTHTVDDHRAVTDLDLDLQITHPWNGDLIVKLAHDSATAVLVHRPGYPIPNPDFGFGDPGLNVVLDDWTTDSIEFATTAGAAPVTGAFRPYPDPLAVFNGHDAYGDWTLTVIDTCTGLTGQLDGWTLRIAEATGPPPGCNVPGDCDFDGDVDLDDFVLFAACLSGPATGTAVSCDYADIDGDGHADLRDFAWFQMAIIDPSVVVHALSPGHAVPVDP